MTYRYPMQAHTSETLQAAVATAFEAALPVADANGVGLVVLVVDLAERVHYQTNLGPTMTAGMLSRCAGLYDAKPAAPHGVPVVLGGISVGPGGGGSAGSSGSVATGGNGSIPAQTRESLYRSGIILGGGVSLVVSDPPQAGGEGRTGSGGGMSAGSPSNPPGAGEGRTLDAPPPLTADERKRAEDASFRAPEARTRADEQLLDRLDAEVDSLGLDPRAPTVRRPMGAGFLECTGCAQPFPAADGFKLRERGKLFRFLPGHYCPDCAARYDRGELDPSSSPAG